MAKGVMVLPFSVTVGRNGEMLDPMQGVYARSLARVLAERLNDPPRLEANPATLTAEGPLEGEDGLRGHGWVVASKPWTLEQACRIGLPAGTGHVIHGAAELTDRVRLRALVFEPARPCILLDHVVVRPRGELFAALDEACAETARALGASAPSQPWPTRDVESFIAYLRGRDVSASHDAGVRVPDPRRSFDGYLDALRRDPKFEDARERLLALAIDFALGGIGPADAARAACHRLIAIDPVAFKAHLTLAEIDLAQRNDAAAELQIEHALAIRPDWSAAYERMATALSRQRRFAEAIPWFQKALEAHSDDVDALQGLGTALMECGNLKQAVLAYRAALFHGADSVQLRRNLSRALEALGRDAEAREEKAQARRLERRPRFGLDLLHEAWEWLSGGTRAGA